MAEIFKFNDHKYFLLDLERSILGDDLYFWKRNKHGYVTQLQDAGLFNETEALEITLSDFDRKTIMIAEKAISKILKLE